MLQDADTTDIYQISRTWADLVKRARSKQLAPDEYNSGNFTISNMGMFGADVFDAILPPGDSDMQASYLAANAAFCNQGRLLCLIFTTLLTCCRDDCHSGRRRQQAHGDGRRRGPHRCGEADEG